MGGRLSACEELCVGRAFDKALPTFSRKFQYSIEGLPLQSMCKKICLVLGFLFILALPSCSDAARAAPIAAVGELEGQPVAVIHTPMDSTPAAIAETEGFTPGEVLVFDTIGEALAALQSGRAKAILGIYREEADFFQSRGDTLQFLPRITDHKTSSLSMLARAANTQLVLDMNAAIEELRADGTLEKLVQDYIADADENSLAAAPAAPNADEGDKTLRIGISGQWPPFDYMTPQGVATGFNVALSSAVAEKLGLHAEFVTIPAAQKFTALMSDRIDVYFFHAIQNLVGESYSATSIYYTDAEIGCLVLK
jgi:polar amino acid transport system substrate-binding protein